MPDAAPAPAVPSSPSSPAFVAAPAAPTAPAAPAPIHHPGQDRRRELAERTDVLLRDARHADAGTRRKVVDEVVTSHLWLADAIAHRFRNRGEDLEDLRQTARAGLVEACGRFDPEQGSFAAFASVTVSGLVKRHFRDHGWSIRPPRPAQELSTLLWRRWPEIAQAVGGEPSDVQLAAALDATVDEVRQARCAGQVYSTSSLDALTAERGDSVGAPDPAGARTEARVLVGSVWNGLTAAEQYLLRMRFFDERSQSDIATVLGTSQMQVSRLLVRVLTKLRALVGSLDEGAELSPHAA